MCMPTQLQTIFNESALYSVLKAFGFHYWAWKRSLNTKKRANRCLESALYSNLKAFGFHYWAFKHKGRGKQVSGYGEYTQNIPSFIEILKPD